MSWKTYAAAAGIGWNGILIVTRDLVSLLLVVVVVEATLWLFAVDAMARPWIWCVEIVTLCWLVNLVNDDPRWSFYQNKKNVSIFKLFSLSIYLRKNTFKLQKKEIRN